MTLRNTFDTIQSLRVLLQELEQCENTPQDAAALAELKRILRHRITELELSVGNLSGKSDKGRGDDLAK